MGAHKNNILCVVVVLLALIFPLLASAERRATKIEAVAIRVAVHTAWTRDCKTQPFRYRGAKVSTVDARYALGLIDDNSCTYTVGWILKRPSTRSEDWRPVGGLADSAQACAAYERSVPERVVHDFKLWGTPSSGQGFGPC